MMDRLESFDNDELMQFVKEPRIQMLGIGGAGNNILTRLYRRGLEGVQTVAINTENDTVQAEVTVSSVDRRRGRRCDKRQQGRPGQAQRRECVLGFFVPLGPVASGSIDTPVPTLGESGLLTLNLLIGVMGIWLLRRSRSLRSQRSGGATG